MGERTWTLGQFATFPRRVGVVYTLLGQQISLTSKGLKRLQHTGMAPSMLKYRRSAAVLRATSFVSEVKVAATSTDRHNSRARWGFPDHSGGDARRYLPYRERNLFESRGERSVDRHHGLGADGDEICGL